MSRLDIKEWLARGRAEFLAADEFGLIEGVSTVHKFGSYDSVGTSLTPICNAGIYRMPTAAVTLAAVSDNANDTAISRI